ncbi:hypothetical protein ABVT39_003424 [Epinephelus coioides]
MASSTPNSKSSEHNYAERIAEMTTDCALDKEADLIPLSNTPVNSPTAKKVFSRKPETSMYDLQMTILKTINNRADELAQMIKSNASDIRDLKDSLEFAPGEISDIKTENAVLKKTMPQPPAGVLHAPTLHSPQCNGSPRTHLQRSKRASASLFISSQSRCQLSATPSPKMAKRKVDAENRGFKARWEAEYMFTEVKGKPVLLLCGESLAVMKEYNLRRHHETSQKHKDKDKNMNMEQRLQKVEELK